MSENNTPKPQSNPYASAAGAYDQHARSHTPDQRELEARVLLKSAKQMSSLQERWGEHTDEELDEVLRYNRQIWLMFVDTAVEDEDPDRSNDLRSNIANLGVFIFNRTVDILAAPEKGKLDILIEINKDIAAGLLAKKGKDENAPAEGEPAPS